MDRRLGDQYGRKYLFLAAIVIFLIGSALGGQSRNMGELIAFRAVQGVGGGGLIVLTQAIIGDIVPARERGRYQRMRRGVRGVQRHRATARRVLRRQPQLALVFYINVPIGAIALVVIVWVPTISSTSRDQAIFVDHATGASLPSYAVLAENHRLW
jgi:hypothetical protein